VTVFDPVTGKRVTRKHDFKTMKINFGSAVADPAQPDATAVLLMKRREDGETPSTPASSSSLETSKRMESGALTTSDQGHAHLIDVGVSEGMTSWEPLPGSDRGHSHPFVVAADGTVVVGQSEGHSHSVAVEARKSAETGDDNGGATVDEKELQAQIEAEKKRADEAEASLAAEKKRADEAEAKVEAAKAAGERTPVYTSKSTGDHFYEDDDARLVAMAKRADEDRERAEKAEAEQRMTSFKARASAELDKLPGSDDVKAKVLKAIDEIELTEDERKEADALFRAANEQVASAFKRNGASGGESGTGGQDAGDVDARWKAGVAKYAKEHEVTTTKAHLAFKSTPEGASLWREREAEQRVNIAKRA